MNQNHPDISTVFVSTNSSLNWSFGGNNDEVQTGIQCFQVSVWNKKDNKPFPPSLFSWLQVKILQTCVTASKRRIIQVMKFSAQRGWLYINICLCNGEFSPVYSLSNAFHPLYQNEQVRTTNSDQSINPWRTQN